MKDNNEKLNVKKINETVALSNKILKIFYALGIITLIFIGILIIRQTKILNILLTILKVCLPVFIGFLIAWLFNPIVTYLEKKGIKRLFSTVVIFITFICLLCLIVLLVIPPLTTQFKEFLNTIPGLFSDIKKFIIYLFSNISSIDGINLHSVQNNLINYVQKYFIGFTKNLPNTIINIFSTSISGIGIFFISLIIGFYMLCNFSSIKKYIFNIIPDNYRFEVRDLLHKISSALYSFCKGILIDASLIFVICSIVFTILGLKAPMLFALFCAITNIIPYIGPYIGAIPAVIVGLTQSTAIGISIGIAIFVIQFIEGNIISPLIMSKQIKLHPVYIIIGLLIFGHFFGIIGMIISTPLLALTKILFEFFSKKINLNNQTTDYNLTKKKSIVIGRKKKNNEK